MGKSEPLLAFHGTFSDIKAFDIEKAGIGFLGLGLYFTDNCLDASDNYANAPWFSRLTGVDVSRFDNQGVVMPVLLDLKNPLIAGGKDTTRFSLSDGSLDLFVLAFKEVAKLYPEVPASGVSYMANTRFPQEARKTRTKSLTMEEITDLVSRQIGLNAGDVFSPDADSRSKMALLQQTFQAMGYDGVVYNDVKKRFGAKMNSITKGTRHYVAFKAEQISPALGSDLYVQLMSEKILKPAVIESLAMDSMEYSMDCERPRC